MTSAEEDGTTHLFSQTDKTLAKSALGTSINEPGDGNSKEYHLSYRVHRLLPKSYPFGSVLASFRKCPRLQPRSELLQEHLLGWGTNNSPSSSNCLKLPYGSRAYSSKCKGGTSTLGKFENKAGSCFSRSDNSASHGKYSSYGRDLKGRAETSHISCKAHPIRLHG